MSEPKIDVTHRDVRRANGRSEKRYLKRFTVCGRGEFPWDMLRYDQCWPERGEDTVKMETGLVGSAKNRTITLLTYASSPNWQPTKGRWQSFLWACSDAELY